MIPMTSGGAYRRPGTLNMDTRAITTDYAPRLLPFISSKNEAYCLMLGKTVGSSAYLNGYRATGNKTGDLVSSTCTGTPPYTFATATTAAAAGVSDDEIHQIQFCQSADVMFLAHPKHKPQCIKRTSKDNFSIVDYDDGLTGIPYVNSRPYLNQNTTATTLHVSATSGVGITLTASTGIFDPLHVGAIFIISDGANNLGSILITAYTNATTLVGTNLTVFGDTSTHTTWWESAWSDYRGWPRSVALFGERLIFGGTDHQPDSLWASGVENYFQQSVLTQNTGSSNVILFPDDHIPGDGKSTGPKGVQPFRMTLAQSTLDQIQWLSPDKQLLVGTLSQEWILSPGSNNSFEVGNVLAQLQSKYGSDYLMASRIGYELIFPFISQEELRAYQYNYIDASYFAEPIQLLFDEYPKPEAGIGSNNPGRRKYRWFEWDVTRETLWCVDTAGNFFGMTRDRKLNVTMWHTHQFGGYDSTKGDHAIGSGGTLTTDSSYYTCDGSVVSFTVVPNPKSGIHDIWLIVKRTINSVVNWQVERIIGGMISRDSAFSTVQPGVSATEPYMVDSAFFANDNGDGSFTYTVGAYLEGQSLVGTYYSPTYGMFKITSGAVSSGVATIAKPLAADYGTASNVVTLGLNFTPALKPTRIEAGSVIGTAQGAIKGIARAYVRLYKTMSGQIGSAPGGQDTNPLEPIVFTDPTAAMGKSPELFTGDKEVLTPTTYDREGYIYMEEVDPLPFAVMAIILEGTEFD